MITKLAAGEIPDVMMLAMDQVPRYALNGMLMPLDDLASQEYKGFPLSVVTEALTVNGTMYAAARDITPKGHVHQHQDVQGRRCGNSLPKIGRWMTLSRWQSS